MPSAELRALVERQREFPTDEADEWSAQSALGVAAQQRVHEVGALALQRGRSTDVDVFREREARVTEGVADGLEASTRFEWKRGGGVSERVLPAAWDAREITHLLELTRCVALVDRRAVRRCEDEVVVLPVLGDRAFVELAFAMFAQCFDDEAGEEHGPP